MVTASRRADKRLMVPRDRADALISESLARWRANKRRVSASAADTSASSPVDWLDTTQPKILHPVDGLIPFIPRSYQREVLADWHERLRLLDKARQLGFTTAFAAEAVWKIKYRGPRTIVTLSRNLDAALEFMGYARRMFDPSELRKDNMMEYTWPDGSRLKAVAATRDAGRSIAASDLYIDEFAHCQFQEALYTAVTPTVSTGGTVTIYSSPAGRGNLFYALWAGEYGQQSWKRYTYTWRELHDDAWAERTQAEMGREAFEQEHGADFRKSADSPFDEDDVRAGFAQAPYAQTTYPQWLCTIDPSGRGRDWTSVKLWDVSRAPYQEVWFDRWQRGPYSRLYKACRDLRERYGAVEFWVDDTGLGDPIVEEIENAVGKGRVHGLVWTPTTKMEGLSGLNIMLQEHRLAYRDPQLRTEFLLYQYDDAGLITDCLMSAALLGYALGARPKPQRKI